MQSYKIEDSPINWYAYNYPGLGTREIFIWQRKTGIEVFHHLIFFFLKKICTLKYNTLCDSRERILICENLDKKTLTNYLNSGKAQE